MTLLEKNSNRHHWTSMSHLKFIPEVEGLRGIAVLSVLIFHLSQNFLPGGFVGVDIFFVISGFLITSIILKELLETNKISMTNFYSKRIKRILPLFCVVVLVTLVVAYPLMLPGDYILLARSALSTLTFSSNFHFSQNIDYFADNSTEYPLLHTWSLAVEEQFYFLWPLILPFALRRFGLRKTLWGLCSFILLGLFYSDLIHAFGASEKMIYFNSFPRFGEIAIGAALALFISDKNPQILPKLSFKLSSSALLLLALSFVLISKQTPFPGLLCLIPCGAAALLILSSRTNNGAISSFLTSGPLRFVGVHSYSLYMWHWPVLALIRYTTGEYELSPPVAVMAVVIIFACSVLSRQWIEKPLLKRSWSFKYSFVYVLLLPFLILFTLSYAIIESGGFPSRIKQLETYEQSTRFIDEKYCHNLEHDECTFGNLQSSKAVYLTGDSHAGHFTPFFDKAIGSVYQITAKNADTCPPLLSVSESMNQFIANTSDESCLEMLREFKEDIKHQKIIIIAANWNKYFEFVPEFPEDLRKTLSLLKDKKVILMTRIPNFQPEAFNRYLRQTYFPLAEYINADQALARKALREKMRNTPDIDLRLKQIASEFPNVRLLNPTTMGAEFWNKVPFADDGSLTYKDAGHFNEAGAESFANSASRELLKLLSELEEQK